MVADNNERNQTGQSEFDNGNPRHPVFALLQRGKPRNLSTAFS
jgi:hypothetical protein